MPQSARKTDAHTCPSFTGNTPHEGGPISSPCSPDVDIENQPASRGSAEKTCDFALCKTGEPDFIAEGSGTVMINNMHATRVGDMTMHAGVITGHASDVEVGGPKVRFRPVNQRGLAQQGDPKDQEGKGKGKEGETDATQGGPKAPGEEGADATQCVVRVFHSTTGTEVTEPIQAWIGEPLFLEARCSCEDAVSFEWDVPSCNATSYDPEARFCDAPRRLHDEPETLQTSSLPLFVLTTPGSHSVSVHSKCPHGGASKAITIETRAPQVSFHVSTGKVGVWNWSGVGWVSRDHKSKTALVGWEGDGRVTWGTPGQDGMQYFWTCDQGSCALVQVIRRAEHTVDAKPRESLFDLRDLRFRFRESGAPGDTPGVPLNSGSHRRASGVVDFEQWLFWREGGDHLWMPVARCETRYSYDVEWAIIYADVTEWRLVSSFPASQGQITGSTAYDTFPTWSSTHGHSDETSTDDEEESYPGQ